MEKTLDAHETMMADKYKRLDTLNSMLNLKFVNLGHYICASHHSEIQRIEEHCGYYKHFCPMYTEAQGETIDDTE